ncbi:MAG: phage tail tube protein [Phycisphaerales bacterium]
MGDTVSSRGYAWGLQTDYQTAKAVAPGAFTRILASDENTIDYNPQINNDEGVAHGKNQATEQWLEGHDCSVQRSMPAYVDQLGRVFILNLGDYSVATPGGGTTSKEHKFKPQDPSVSRQGKAVTYLETTGPGYNVSMPRAVANGFTLRGDGNGILTVDFGLQGAGKVDPASTATWSPAATPSVTDPTDRVKFFNTQVALTATPSGESAVVYGCRYRMFEMAYEQTLLLEAGFKPGCQDFLVPGDPTSGVIRSACEFDKQRLSFSFEVDMASGSPELVLVQNQKPIDILLTATGPLIEGAIRKKLSVIVPVSHYRTSKPSVKNGIYTFAISGEGFFDYATSKLLEVQLINTIASYATGW